MLIQNRFFSLTTACRSWLLALGFVFAALLPSLSFASGCTAMWGILQSGTTARLAYYNNSAGTASKWTTLSFALSSGATAPNALAGDSTTGVLYYFDRTNTTLRSVNLNTYVDTNLGAVAAPPAAAPAANIIGATFDSSGQLYLMTSSGASGRYFIAAINKATPNSATTWRTVTYTAGAAVPASGGSGDIVFDQGGQAYLATNTATLTIYPLNLATAQVGTSVTFGLTNASFSVAGIAVNPADGKFFVGSANSGSITFQVNPTVTNAATKTDATTGGSPTYAITDMGNCVIAPDAPTISKTFSPTYAPLSGTTTTLYLAIGNSNTVPIWLDTDFKDVLPAGMTIATPNNLSTGACVASTTVTNVITATATQNTVTFATGGRIPAGGCTITLSVTAAAATNAYTNSIAISDLSTTSGDNAAASTAVYKVGTDFDAKKYQCLTACGTTTTSVITVPGGQTLQYVLNITNSSVGGTGSATFSDTLPVQMTPVLSITAGMTGGGACTTASAVIGSSTVITGTITNALAGSVCSVTVTTLVSKVLSVSTNVTNTLTVSPTASTSDTSSANNTATVPATIGPSANISVVKTNGISPTVVAGTSVFYTITVVNSGPSQAAGTLVQDPASTGLSCSTVTCTSAGGATCPAASFPYTNMTSGVTLTPFPSASTATFVVSCGVTATGLP